MDIKELTIGSNKEICHVVFDDLDREDIESYLRGIRKPEEDYSDLPFSFTRHTPSNSEEISGVIPAEVCRKMQEKKRQDLLEQHKDSPYVDYTFIDLLSESENKVMSCDFDFHIGDISVERWDARKKLFYEFKGLWLTDEEIREGYQRRIDSLAKIKEYAEKGIPIFIWHGENANNLCGFLFLISELEDTPCTTVDVHVSAGMKVPDGKDLDSACYWRVIPNELKCAPLSRARVLSEDDTTRKGSVRR